MGLTFKALANFTPYTWRVVNTADHGDDYTVPPYSNAWAHTHDAQLPRGNGTKGVSLHCNLPSGDRLILHMWEHDCMVKMRLGNQTGHIHYDPNTGGNLDFWIDVHPEKLAFRTHLPVEGGGSADSSILVIGDWKETCLANPA